MGIGIGITGGDRVCALEPGWPVAGADAGLAGGLGAVVFPGPPSPILNA